MAVCDALGEDGIVRNLIPVDLLIGQPLVSSEPLQRSLQGTNILQVLLLQDGEQKSRHGIVIARSHDGDDGGTATAMKEDWGDQRSRGGRILDPQ